MATLRDWPEAVHLIGVGGIGTHVLLALIELGAREVHVWDDDIVSPHNRPNQFIYNKDDIGRPKVNGARRFVRSQQYDTIVIRHNRRVTKDTRLSGIVISGVDSMASRTEIWEAVCNSGGLVSTYIDGRIGDDHVWVFTTDPYDHDKAERYQSTLYSDEEAADLSCTTRQNPHSALTVASIVSINLSLLLAEEPVNEADYRILTQEAQRNVRHLLDVS